MTLQETLRRLLEAAQGFEMKTPQYRRIECEWQALREAIMHAQLMLSVQELPKPTQKHAGTSLRTVPSRTSKKTGK
jgi:hypothetical protein